MTLAARLAITGGMLLSLAAWPARAELPTAATLLADLGLDASEIAQVQAGQIVSYVVKPASERELTAGLAFQVGVAPAALVQQSQQDLLNRVDPAVLAHGTISNPAQASDFARLTLQPGAASRAAAYVGASPGESLNLSAAEIAAFNGLGAGASVSSVEQQVRAALLARAQAYQSQGLAGLAPYARSDGERQPGAELVTATKASQALSKYAPNAFRAILEYPGAQPPGTQQVFRWSQFDAHGTPTIALTHVLTIPDGDAWIVLQRQFYVSTGYNVEQALAAFLPASDGTVVVYANRTSTDQITGFGGGTKRDLGSRILASQLESMFEKARAAVK